MFSPSLSVWDDSFLAYSLQPVALQGLHRVPWMCMSVLLNWNSFDSFKHIGKSSHFGMKMYIFCIKSWLCFCVSVFFLASHQYITVVTFFSCGDMDFMKDYGCSKRHLIVILLGVHTIAIFWLCERGLGKSYTTYCLSDTFRHLCY